MFPLSWKTGFGIYTCLRLHYYINAERERDICTWVMMKLTLTGVTVCMHAWCRLYTGIYFNGCKDISGCGSFLVYPDCVLTLKNCTRLRSVGWMFFPFIVFIKYLYLWKTENLRISWRMFNNSIPKDEENGEPGEGRRRRNECFTLASDLITK